MSYQSTGWNDCPPILDIAPNGPRRKRNASRTQHNTLNNGFMNNAKENNATGDAAAAQTNESTGGILENFDKLVRIPNKLSDKEFNHYVKKLKANLPGALENNEYKNIIANVISDILVQQNLSEAKSLLINFMLVNPGVVNWALPLRKVIENVVV